MFSRTKSLTPRVALRRVTTEEVVVFDEEDTDVGPDSCCVDPSGNYVECERHERERFESSDAIDSHHSLLRTGGA